MRFHPNQSTEGSMLVWETVTTEKTAQEKLVNASIARISSEYDGI